ncbi:hypothetical protein NPIL_616851 [Nephila pilipes]|uniref:Uncharacterized protein n=1 Tax=Nephila pilipes TaxID=299642 RepID=A0A8X6P7E9_NEPPI|nr:hypothetical protein NPIL_616851 [Nephila pilipes]
MTEELGNQERFIQTQRFVSRRAAYLKLSKSTRVRKDLSNESPSHRMKANACISQNGNQEMCDHYIQCAYDHFEDQLRDAFDECRDKVYPNGFGNCNGDQTLFISPLDQLKSCLIKYGGNCATILEGTSSL